MTTWTRAFTASSAVILILTSSTVLGAPAPCSDIAYDQFDFWLGNWDVRSTAGVVQGANKIQKEEGNCLIVERWTSVGGGTGQSYNYYNPADKKWRQLWISQGAIIDYQGGLTKQNAMHLVGHIHYQADGRTADFQGTWTPRADGSVLQEFKEKEMSTGKWKDWFTGVYTPQLPEKSRGSDTK